ncbi:acyl carrier protein [candidate division KSB1 bacterium]|nr:acyl carrier protein [candidate division KSB1 bacterium]
MSNEKYLHIIYAVIDEINEQLDKNQRLEKSRDTVLVGQSGKLDSLGMVNFIVGLEQKVEEETGKEISLADQMLNMGNDSPFRTVEWLAQYLSSIVEE